MDMARPALRFNRSAIVMIIIIMRITIPPHNTTHTTVWAHTRVHTLHSPKHTKQKLEALTCVGTRGAIFKRERLSLCDGAADVRRHSHLHGSSKV